ncbi:MAG: NAD(P)H-binding protein [Myxococcota bacterium]
MSTFAIAGVTGHTGRVAAETLLAHGHAVRVVVRDAAKGAEWRARGAEVAVADLLDTAAFAAALRGTDGAYVLLPPNFATGDLRGWQARAGAALVDGVRASGVRHVVLLSSIGAQHPSGTGPIAGLYPVERALAGLGETGATLLRASYFMENLLGSLGLLDQGLFPSFTPKDFAWEMVATRDIGEVAAALLIEGPPAPGSPRVVELGGPKRSAGDVAAALAAKTGRPIAVAEAPVSGMAQALQGYGVPADVAALYQEMTEGILSGRVAFEGGHRRATGRVSLEAFLATATGGQ